ncbi:187-kDa microtubule-associated protein AIR9-like isoform X2 [Mangifera indica]|uniref:187-kDa microtubule-associated protein AIR9-like isoform X2 n=1 Tax=Mangifera indica TaxID=29780 RepID=UPI001CFB1FEF|nr:187-kDa microtubule-associated protein AIR9-like isoform X2 [Mangifera indica]XP_044501876.1 187-kDa microtubule-associated protein AIR9-like isoform X2 [Mangifera indica]
MMQMSKVVKRSMLKTNKFIAPFRMTNDNPSFEPPKATNVKIHGDLKENNKITIIADVNGGVEVVSVVQWYKTTTIELDIQNGLEEISMCTTEKEFLLPIGVSGYYIVAKYTPMTFDGKSGEPVFVTSENVVESEIYTQKRKVRGKNHNEKVSGLKNGEKLPIVFYNNRAVEENHQSWQGT